MFSTCKAITIQVRCLPDIQKDPVKTTAVCPHANVHHMHALPCRLAAVLVQHHGYPSGLINLIIKRFTDQAGFEKHSIAVEELAGAITFLHPLVRMACAVSCKCSSARLYCSTGFMQEVARAALLLHVTDEDMYDQQDDLSALLIRPLLKNAAK